MKTDNQLQLDVIEESGCGASINSAQIGVAVTDGKEARHSQLARHTAWNTPGVQGVIDNITVIN